MTLCLTSVYLGVFDFIVFYLILELNDLRHRVVTELYIAIAQIRGRKSAL